MENNSISNRLGRTGLRGRYDQRARIRQRSRLREALQGVSWLRSVPSRTLDGLASQAVLHRVPAGSLLFNQAEIPAFAQFLLAGSVELLGVRGRAETLIELLQPVDLIIPAAVIGGQPYLMRARVYKEAHLLLVEAEAFREALASDHALCRAVLGCLAAQFRRQVRMQKNLKLRSAEERVGCYLVSLLGAIRRRYRRPIADREASDRLATRHDARNLLPHPLRNGEVRNARPRRHHPGRGCRRGPSPLPPRSAHRRLGTDQSSSRRKA